jgi:hypothetical protein
MMRFLANENIPGDLVQTLRETGHDVAWTAEDMPGSSDRDNLERAQTEQRVLLTFDKDFGELAFRSNLSSFAGVVLFRLRLKPPSSLVPAMAHILESRQDWPGHFTVIEEDRVRMRPLPSSSPAEEASRD